MTDSEHLDLDSDSSDVDPQQGGRWTDEIAALDEAVKDAVFKASTPTLDVPIRCISNAADYGRLRFATAAVVPTLGGRQCRASDRPRRW